MCYKNVVLLSILLPIAHFKKPGATLGATKIKPTTKVFIFQCIAIVVLIATKIFTF
jgi:hypothetical protein